MTLPDGPVVDGPVLDGPVLVTGGSSGLGAAVVAALAKRGGTAVVLDRIEPAPGVAYVPVDLSDPVAAHEAVERAVHEAGAPSAVVTAAGTDACGRLDDVSLTDWLRVVQVNLLGTAAVVRAALPLLRRHHGRVVTVASTLGLKAVSDATAYCASKFGVIGFDGRTEQYRTGPDAVLNDPADVAQAVLFALSQPAGCELRELVVAPSTEPSWP